MPQKRLDAAHSGSDWEGGVIKDFLKGASQRKGDCLTIPSANYGCLERGMQGCSLGIDKRV